jgi:limonene-1,2-epoxide hydrolase
MGAAPDYEALVREFCQAWVDADHDKVVAFFTEDGVYHNIPVDPLVGHDAIRAMVDGFTNGMGLKVVEFRIDVMLSRGSTVVTERVDIFAKADGVHVELPVLGIFEFEGDKIAHWREYFDMNQFMAQIA